MYLGKTLKAFIFCLMLNFYGSPVMAETYALDCNDIALFYTDIPSSVGMRTRTIDFAFDCLTHETNAFTGKHETLGAIYMRLNEPHDISAFKLWNDHVVISEGVKEFNLVFRTVHGAIIHEEAFEAMPGVIGAQIFELSSLAVDASNIEMHIESYFTITTPHRVEIREIGFVAKTRPRFWFFGVFSVLFLVLTFVVTIRIRRKSKGQV